ncbi:YetF domain-containing protein [Brevibacillus reuszeri]|uniref:YetF domain-containing protein n=1 Tax=Brevibacillus reuszeri TaxID=54915 RepID=UPI0026A5B591|nr:YetF domain-containing protein [Brevibacillus reuszeri]
MDSNIVEKNLKEFGLTKEWLFQELEKHGVYSLHEVFYAELQEDGSLLVDKKGNSREYHH